MATSDRLLGILDLFTMERPDWSVEEAASALDLSSSTAYRYFGSLSNAGLLASFDSGRYVLGPTIIRYDRQLRLTDPMISAARAEMDRVARLEPGRIVVFLCCLLNGQVMCTHQAAIDSPSFGVSYERGRLMPLFMGSASKIILAYLPPRQLRALYRRSADDFAAAGFGDTWDEVRGALREIRTAGLYSTSGEIDTGMRGISVALRGSSGSIAGSLTIAAPRAFLTAPLVTRLGRELQRAGGSVEAEYGRIVQRTHR